MKVKNVSKQITQDILRNEFSSYEQNIDKKLEKLGEEIHGEMQEMREEHKQYKDEVLTKLDDISGQLENLQEDKVLSIHQTSELRKDVDGHEERIKNLEKIPQTA